MRPTHRHCRFVILLAICFALTSVGLAAAQEPVFQGYNSTERPATLQAPREVQPLSPTTETATNQSRIIDPFVTQASANTREPLALRPRSEAGGAGEESVSKPPSSKLGPIITMFTSLLVVVSLFLGLMVLLKKARGSQGAELPREVFQVLGTSRLAGRHPLFLLRLGQKLILVHAASGEVQTITEISDLSEVDRICGSCEANHSHSLTQSFKHVLKQVTEGTGSRSSYSDNGRLRRTKKDDAADELSPALAILAKEQS